MNKRQSANLRINLSCSVTTTDWSKVLQLIPGYDPTDDAGDCVFDSAVADWFIEFIETCLTHVKGELAGTPLRLEDWQKAFFGNLFGWLRPDGTRRYRESLLYIPRKNSKTTMASAIACVGLFLDNEPGAEIYSSAAEREQARICFDITKGMIENEDRLYSRADLYKYSIVVGDKNYKAISAEAKSKHGFNAHLVLNDELHAHTDRELTDVLMTSTGARRQPLVVHLTTADFDRPSICNEKYEYACQVRDGVINDRSFLPVIFEAKSEDDWTSPRVWKKANPNLGVSISQEYLERECERAKSQKTYQNTFQRLHLNVRTGQSVRWIKLEDWDNCKPRRTLEELAGKDCFGGLDLSSKIDLTALVLVFPDSDGYDVIPYFWIPEETAVQREREDRVPYSTWHREGLIEFTEGNVIDGDWIRRKISGCVGDLGTTIKKDHDSICDTYRIRRLAFDPWSATQVSLRLAGDGIEMVECRQGFASLSEPSKELEKLVVSGQFRHGGNPVLRWMAGNVAAVGDAAGNIKPDKGKSKQRIDGIVGSVMGVSQAIMVSPPRESVYKTRGIRSMFDDE